jgi:hypothetical protein
MPFGNLVLQTASNNFQTSPSRILDLMVDDQGDA